jgi:hypothetical protein
MEALLVSRLQVSRWAETYLTARKAAHLPAEVLRPGRRARSGSWARQPGCSCWTPSPSGLRGCRIGWRRAASAATPGERNGGLAVLLAYATGLAIGGGLLAFLIYTRISAAFFSRFVPFSL